MMLTIEIIRELLCFHDEEKFYKNLTKGNFDTDAKITQILELLYSNSAAFGLYMETDDKSKRIYRRKLKKILGSGYHRTLGVEPQDRFIDFSVESPCRSRSSSKSSLNEEMMASASGSDSKLFLYFKLLSNFIM